MVLTWFFKSLDVTAVYDGECNPGASCTTHDHEIKIYPEFGASDVIYTIASFLIILSLLPNVLQLSVWVTVTSSHRLPKTRIL